MYKYIDEDRRVLIIDLPKSDVKCSVVVGHSQAMKNALFQLRKVAPTHHPVLISGPTGVGKEWSAAFLHADSDFSEEPFVDVNCGAISHDLFESLIFGHVKGAFTGAHQAQVGLLEQVGKGTLFLDEIGELPLDQQPKLLRVLETRQYRPVGARDSKIFNGRIIAATHRNLEKMVEDGSFREDLYHRISVCLIKIPSLKERKEDIPLLVSTFASEFDNRIEFDESALNFLKSFAWSGNIRQLKNTVRRLSVFSDEKHVTREILENFLFNKEISTEDILQKIADDILLLDVECKLPAIEHALIDRALERCAGQKTKAAKLLGMHRKSLERRCKQVDHLEQQLSDYLSNADEYLYRGDYKNSSQQLIQAESIIQQLPENKDLNKCRRDIHLKQSICQRNLSGWNAELTQENYEKAHCVSKKEIHAEGAGDVLFGQWAAKLVDLKLMDAKKKAAELLELGISRNHEYYIGAGLAANINTSYWLGDFSACEKYAAQYFEERQLTSLLSYDQAFDPFPLALMFRSLVYIHHLNIDDSYLVLKKLIQYEENVVNPFIRALVLHSLIWLHHMLEEHDISERYTDDMLSVCKTEEFLFYKGYALIFKGYFLVKKNGDRAGIEMMQDGFFKEMHQNEGLLFHSYYSLLLAEAHLELNDFDSAALVLEQALHIAVSETERPYIPQLHMLLSRCYVIQGDVSRAVDEIQSAWIEARNQKNSWLQIKIIAAWLEYESSVGETPFHEFEIFLLRYSHLKGSALYDDVSEAFRTKVAVCHSRAC